MIGSTLGVDAHCTQLVAPRDGGLLILERADRLPVLDARVADEDRRFPRGAALAMPAQRHPRSLALRPLLGARRRHQTQLARGDSHEPSAPRSGLPGERLTPVT